MQLYRGALYNAITRNVFNIETSYRFITQIEDKGRKTPVDLGGQGQIDVFSVGPHQRCHISSLCSC